MSTAEYVILEPTQPGFMQSTGPKTEAGKARSSMNALKTGLRSQKVVLPGEDEEAFEAFRLALVTELSPVGIEEAVMADKIASLHWKMARFERAEYELLTKEPTPARLERTAADKQAHVTTAEASQRPSATPLADAIIAHSRELALVLRYRGQAGRELERARRDYRLLQKERREQTLREATERRLRWKMSRFAKFKAEQAAAGLLTAEQVATAMENHWEKLLKEVGVRERAGWMLTPEGWKAAVEPPPVESNG